MFNVPLPVLIGAGMILAGVIMGIVIAVKAVNANRRNHPYE